MYEPLPFAADILVDSSVKGVFDKGKEKGALIITETDIKLKDSGKLICKLGSTTLLEVMEDLVAQVKELLSPTQFLIEMQMMNLKQILNLTRH